MNRTGPRSIPIPPDFRASAAEIKAALAGRYGVSEQTITRWRTRLGFDFRSHKKTLPADFATLAPGKTFRELKQHYGAGEGTIRQWRKLCGLGPAEPNAEAARMARLVDTPADFRERAAELHLVALARHYGHTEKLIRRWLREAGISAKQIRHPKPETAATIRRGPGRPPITPRQAAPLAGRDEEAAQYLRRFAAVYRCGPKGAADPGGKLWRYGNAILTAAELQDRAQRHGWDPDQWRVIAGHPIRPNALPSFPRAGVM